jgi:hypothetical protein
VVKLLRLGGLGRLGKRKKLSVIIPVIVLKNTDFSLFSPSFPRFPRFPSSFHDDLTFSRCSLIISRSRGIAVSSDTLKALSHPGLTNKHEP